MRRHPQYLRNYTIFFIKMLCEKLLGLQFYTTLPKYLADRMLKCENFAFQKGCLRIIESI